MAAASLAKNRDVNDYCAESSTGPNPNTTSSTSRIEVARIQYEAFKLSLQDYLPQEPQNHRANARQKLARLTRGQFRELSVDVYDELVRRNESEKGGASFLPIRDDFHPKRNQARQKLSTLPATRFNDLSSDVFYELGRRYPEIKEPDIKMSEELPRIPDSPPPAYEPPITEVVVGDMPNRQNCLVRFVRRVRNLFRSLLSGC